MIKEACVESLKEAILAEERGADRIELCSALHLDGLTPSVELMQKACNNLKIPVMVMIRPKAGDFIYSENDILQMEVEIGQAKMAGAAGVVFGLLTPENGIDEANTRRLAAFAQPLPVTFHKAIDDLEDPVKGAQTLKKIEGIHRILTSGGEPTALEGQATIREMMKVTKGKITILVAGKVLNSNIAEIQKTTGGEEFHGRKIVGELTKNK